MAWEERWLSWGEAVPEAEQLVEANFLKLADWQFGAPPALMEQLGTDTPGNLSNALASGRLCQDHSRSREKGTVKSFGRYSSIVSDANMCQHPNPAVIYVGGAAGTVMR